jgi:hypothetical protein
MTIQIPNVNRELVDTDRTVTNEWISFFTQFGNQPTGVMSLLVGASPFIYTAKEPGNIAVSGGTVSAIKLIRGAIIIDVTGMKLVSVETKDRVSVTYSMLPMMQFLPRY